MAETTSTEKSTGTVKWFSARRGFGFITPDDGGDELFVHRTSILSQGFRTLSDDQLVEFSLDLGEDGRAKAVDVTPLPRSRRGGGGGYRRGGYGGGGACYNCGKMGHLERDCYQDDGGSMSYSGGRGDAVGSKRYGRGGGGSGREEGRVGGKCFTCGEEGHLARDCSE